MSVRCGNEANFGRRMRVSRRRMLWSSMGLLAVVAVIVNTPLSSAVAEVIGVGRSNVPQMASCNQQGFSLVGDLRILPSPESFDPGPHGRVLRPIARSAAAALVKPVWYVTSNPRGAFISTCDGGASVIRHTEVGQNPDTGEQLFVAGVPK